MRGASAAAMPVAKALRSENRDVASGINPGDTKFGPGHGLNGIKRYQIFPARLKTLWIFFPHFSLEGLCPPTTYWSGSGYPAPHALAHFNVQAKVISWVLVSRETTGQEGHEARILGQSQAIQGMSTSRPRCILDRRGHAATRLPGHGQRHGRNKNSIEIDQSISSPGNLRLSQPFFIDMPQHSIEYMLITALSIE